MAVSWRSCLLELQFNRMCVWWGCSGLLWRSPEGISKLGLPLGKVHLKPCALFPDIIAVEKLGNRALISCS